MKTIPVLAIKDHRYLQVHRAKGTSYDAQESDVRRLVTGGLVKVDNKVDNPRSSPGEYNRRDMRAKP